MKSEPNEREAFLNWFDNFQIKKEYNPRAWEAWQHQQNRIDELEKKLLSSNFWKSVYEDGITSKDVENEMADFHFMLNEVPKVYMEVTGGLLSKPNYHASDVISAFNNHVEDLFKEDIESLQAKLTVAVKALEEIRVTHSEDWCNTYALEAIAEINKIGE
jgi:hypothetical protein